MGFPHCDHHKGTIKKPSGLVKGRPVENPEIERRRQMRNSKLRPVHTVLEIHEKEELDRKRVAPKETILVPPQQNIMYDYRVHRGSPHAQLKSEQLPPPRKLKRKNDGNLSRSRTPTPRPKKLDCYLEPLPKPDREDPDPPPPKRPIPPFAPWPVPPQKETQIWPGDLFWFDDDVEPMIEQLVGRCLEQGYMECQEGWSIEAMRAQQENFEFIKICEVDTWQRMRLAEIRVNEERERRIEQEKIAEYLEILLKIKVEATGIANGFLKRLKTEVLGSLEAKGMFKDPLEDELREMYIPGLIKNMELEYNEIVKYRLTVNLLVDETVECPLYMERAEDGMDIILARLISILDSWISFEDNCMMELDAAESASKRIMEGSVGEVGLVTETSETLLGGMIETTGEASDMAHRIVDNVLNQWREDEQFGDDESEDEEY
ncbi:hypothetical protein M758_1G030000 [Ceratodon purpureus]|nr:hypothetical protein M758_1G030000 [Ceratodon purpureus]KAG0628477.1 hypothetical protein M758_1G030000 [Ceratodon purpureus]KAG0628478.1 hypothetical protein M758_1G030000 [Ceratodon purpureus]KAG0628479.1 hypothetical protein M758_1G030000 [Ceratodon purpureus]